MLLPGLLLAAGSLLAQGPASSLQKEFASQDPATRLHAALRYVASESPDPKWLRKELHHGSPGRTRALLVAAALLGTEDSLSLVEEASRRGKRKDSLRAFALLLYGAFHPRVVAEFGESLHRPASSEERDLLLAGTLMQARRLPALSSLPEGRDRDAAQSSPIAIFLDALF